MKNILGITLIRKKRQCLICLLLVILASSVILSSVYEYWLIDSQINQGQQYYKQNGYLESIEGYRRDAKIDPECVELLSESQYISYINAGTTYRTQIPDILTYTEWLSYALNGANIVFVYGQVQGIKKNALSHLRSVVEYEDDSCTTYDAFKTCERSDAIQLDILKVVSGEEGRLIFPAEYFYISGDDSELDAIDNTIEIGKTYLFQIQLDGGNANDDIGRGQSGNIMPVAGTDLYAYPIESEDEISKVIDENPVLAEAMNRLEEDLHMFRTISVHDMNSLSIIQSKNWYLKEGRLLYEADSESKNAVCVISDRLALRRGLTVGDKIKLQIGDIGSSNLKTTLSLKDDIQWEAWASANKVEKEVEIVGIIDSQVLTGAYAIMFANDIYVPESLLKNDFADSQSDVYLDLFGFTLKNPSDAEPFQKEYGELIKSFGYQVVLSECNWQSFFTAAQELKNGKLMMLVMLGIPSVGLILIVAFLLKRNLKNELVIMRLLGSPRKKIATQYIMSNSIIGVIGIICGMGISYMYANSAIKKSVSAIDELFVTEKLDVGRCLSVAVVLIILYVVVITLTCIDQLRKNPMERIQKVKKE